MNSLASPVEDEKTLAALALAMVDHPRATLQELAKAIGVSKATLYRFCKTREQLIERLFDHSASRLRRSIDEAELESGPAVPALRRLIQGQLVHKELTAFLTYYWKPDSMQDPRGVETWTAFDAAVDAFFLRGQQEGAFRIDISAAALTETLFSMVIGLLDAERRGRVARAAVPDMVEQVFLRGVAAPAK
jgi:TetR/AcrR family transcriptional repressor of mexCD-oprJ operon